MAELSVDAMFFEVPALQARGNRHAVAIVHEGRPTTYGELAGQCEGIASVLWHEWGVREGDRVAWLGANHPAQVALLFALSRIGVVLLPLNSRLAPAEWRALLLDCAPRFLVHDEAFAEAAQALGSPYETQVKSVLDLVAPARREPAPLLGSPSSPVLLVYTSGTTGRARAAVHTQANLLANMRIASQAQAMTARDVVATMLPLFHVGGLCIQTLPALFAGAKVILHSRFTPDAAFDCFERDRPTLTLQVPATMRALLEHPRWPDADLSSLRAMWAGSSLLPQALVNAFIARGVPVGNVYGATETGPFSIALAPELQATHEGSCGWPATGVEAVLGDTTDGVGEIYVRGPNVVASYWPREAACDEQGWFHTGDLARVADDGSFTVVGRLKDLIISGGENIHPAEIEALLVGHHAVEECAAFALPSEQWGEIVAVAVVLKPHCVATEQELEVHLTTRLARFKLPRRWFFVESLPKTALGKLQRSQLPRLLE